MTIPFPSSVAFVAVVVLVGALLVQTLRLSWRTSLPARRLAASRTRGAAGEREARAIVERLGFSIVGEQVATRYELRVDGENVPFDLRADLVVERGERRYVAEVKTGLYAPKLTTISTRRQLLEYGVAFDVDGVLLVDAESGTVRIVELPHLARREESTGPLRAAWLVVGAVGGAAVSTWLGLHWP